MTLEQAKAIIERNPYNSIIASDTIDKIYADFKRGQDSVLSRSCESCKFSQETQDCGYDFYCHNLQDYMYDIQSCSKWEQK